MYQQPNPYQQQPNPYAQQPAPYGAQPPGQYPGAHNPYAPPTQGGYGYDMNMAGEHVLAERGTRFVAKLLDGALGLAAALPMFPAIIMMLDRGPDELLDDGLIFFAVGMLTLLALGIYQLVLLSTRGQTLGKKWMGIKIVKMDGSEPGFVHAWLLRNFVMGLIGNIPVIGPLVSLADPFLIFAEDRRCIHDHVAGTKVIVA